jgi:hypothetical protein
MNILFVDLIVMQIITKSRVSNNSNSDLLVKQRAVDILHIWFNYFYHIETFLHTHINSHSH